MLNLQDHRASFLGLCELETLPSVRTFDQILNDAGFKNTKELARFMRTGGVATEHCHASYTTLRHWMTGRTIPRLNVFGIIQLCALLKVSPLEFTIAANNAHESFLKKGL